MSNGNAPAYPISVAVGPGGDHITGFEYEGGEGLTKREMFAMSAMKGLLAFYGDGQEWDVTAREATACADALLRELEA